VKVSRDRRVVIGGGGGAQVVVVVVVVVIIIPDAIAPQSASPLQSMVTKAR
jgi:hypothetical protein